MTGSTRTETATRLHLGLGLFPIGLRNNEKEEEVLKKDGGFYLS